MRAIIVVALSLFGLQEQAGPRSGLVSIRTDPPGATVFIDDKETGITPLEGLSLAAGVHRIRVAKDAFVDGTRAIIVVPGTTDTILIRLTKDESVAATAAPAVFTTSSGEAPSLRIVVLKGEDAVNIIQQKTAVAPIVEIRDRNNLPVSGALVTFAIEGGKGASFGGVSTLTVATNAAGQATATGLSPLVSGTMQINVQAAFQGQVAATTIAQTNVMTAAQAAAATGGTTSANQATAAGGQASGGMSKGLLIGIAAAGGGALGVVAATRGEDPPPACSFTVTPTTFNPIAGSGGSVNVSIAVSPVGCGPATWTASSSSSFASVSPSSGTGNATVTITVAANPVGAASRTWSVIVARQALSGTQNQTFPPCNSQQVAGGDTPEIRTIELGRTSGTITFTYNTYSLPDRMTLVYEGRTLFDTGCVGTLVPRSQVISYSGRASTVSVQVSPRCAGGSGTIWDFIVSCPR